MRILKAEIPFLKPSLIVCVAADSIYDDFFYQALNTTRGQDGFQEKTHGDLSVYVRAGLVPYPPILWMKHPERKTKAYLDFAEAEALQLLGITDS